MNYLELAQETMAILRIGQGDIGEEPVAVANQQGKSAEVLRFVRRSWIDIQNDQTGWRFMRKEGLLTLPQGQRRASTASIDDFDTLMLADSEGSGRFITMYSDSVSDERPVRFVPWADWQQSHLARGPFGVGEPGRFSLRPDGQLDFDLIANRAYTLRVWYKRTPQLLAVATDVPIMASRYRMAIVWWAVNRYYCATRADAKNLYAMSRENLMREMRKLIHDQLDESVGYEVGP